MYKLIETFYGPAVERESDLKVAQFNMLEAAEFCLRALNAGRDEDKYAWEINPDAAAMEGNL